MKRDFNGTPASEYNGTHLSADVKGNLAAAGVAAAEMRRVAGMDPTGDGIKRFGASTPNPAADSLKRK